MVNVASFERKICSSSTAWSFCHGWWPESENKGRTAKMNLHLWVKVHLWVKSLISIELYHHPVLCVKLLHTTKPWAPHLQKLQTAPNNTLNRELSVSWLGRKDTRVWNRSQGILSYDRLSKTVQMQITKGHRYQALVSWHLFLLDALGFEKRGKYPVFMY